MRRRAKPFVPRYERDLRRAERQPPAIEAAKPATTHVASRRLRLAAIPVGAGIGTGAYLAHRHNQQKGKTVAKSLINPFTEVVVFGKALPLDPQASTVIRALVPTGRHIGHGNDLVRGTGRRKGGPATRLELYRGSTPALRTGPFGKSDVLKAFGAPKTARRVQMIWESPAFKENNGRRALGVSRLRGRVVANEINSKIPSGARKGKRL